MVKHIIIWNLKDEYSTEEKAMWKEKIKTGLEDLQGKIDGIISIKVYSNFLDGSSGDIILDSTFESVEALNAYQTNPLHMAVATSVVRPNVKTRSCADFVV